MKNFPIHNKPKTKDLSRFTESKKNQAPKWAFSFKYFNQIDYFGLGSADPQWFVSVLNRFKDLSFLELSLFSNNYTTKDAYRYHPINWNAKNIPYQKEEFTWVDKHYLTEEFSFYQFQLSTAKGRIVGFWDETSTIFYIVLLDPLHNMQPSRDYGYRVDTTHPLNCKYSSLMLDINNLKKEKCADINCGFKKIVDTIPTEPQKTNVITTYMDDDFYAEYSKISEKFDFSQILMGAVMYYRDNPEG